MGLMEERQEYHLEDCWEMQNLVWTSDLPGQTHSLAAHPGDSRPVNAQATLLSAPAGGSVPLASQLHPHKHLHVVTLLCECLLQAHGAGVPECSRWNPAVQMEGPHQRCSSPRWKPGACSQGVGSLREGPCPSWPPGRGPAYGCVPAVSVWLHAAVSLCAWVFLLIDTR